MITFSPLLLMDRLNNYKNAQKNQFIKDIRDYLGGEDSYYISKKFIEDLENTLETPNKINKKHS